MMIHKLTLPAKTTFLMIFEPHYFYQLVPRGLELKSSEKLNHLEQLDRISPKQSRK